MAESEREREKSLSSPGIVLAGLLASPPPPLLLFDSFLPPWSAQLIPKLYPHLKTGTSRKPACLHCVLALTHQPMQSVTRTCCRLLQKQRGPAQRGVGGVVKQHDEYLPGFSLLSKCLQREDKPRKRRVPLTGSAAVWSRSHAHHGLQHEGVHKQRWTFKYVLKAGLGCVAAELRACRVDRGLLLLLFSY